VAREMSNAIAQWLVARANFYAHGRNHRESYRAANAWLLEAFAKDWTADNPAMLIAAYQEFRAGTHRKY
jgi:hypothetical protein